MPSICIATAIPVIRDGVHRALMGERGTAEFVFATDGNDVLHIFKSGGLAALVLDDTLPGPGSEALLRRFAQSGKRIPTILFGDWTPESAAAAVHTGAWAILSVREETAVFARAVQEAVSGKRYVSDRMHVLLCQAERHPVPGECGIELLLTRTERQVLRALAENRTSKEIGEEMYISFRTVQKHRSNIVRKLNLDGTNALLALAVRHFGEHRREPDIR